MGLGLGLGLGLGVGLGRFPPRLARLLMVEVDVAVVILHAPPAWLGVGVGVE